VSAAKVVEETRHGLRLRVCTEKDKRRRKTSGSHAGVRFGNCIVPCAGKDHDRCAEANAVPEVMANNGRGLLYSFVLCDGHGRHAAVADIASAEISGALAGDKRWHSDYLSRDPSDKDNSPESSAPAAFFRECAAAVLGDAFARAQAASLARFPSHRIGSTATALVLARSPGAFAWQVAAAWVGDSRAILVPKDGGGGGLDVGDGAVALTEDHRTDLPRERERVLKVQAAEKDAPRGKRKTVLARRVCDKTGMVGPEVLYNEATGVSLMVTRTIGDPLRAEAVLAEPELGFFEARDGDWLVLASDGVWDVMSNKDVADVVRKGKDPTRAAVQVATAAKQRRLYGALAPDDISVYVIEINSSWK